MVTTLTANQKKQEQAAPLLAIQKLTVSFPFGAEAAVDEASLEVISGLDLTVQAGEILAVAGSSGSGKSLLAHAIMGLLPATACQSGSIFYRGQKLTDEGCRRLRGRAIGLIPQGIDSLDPLMPAGRQLLGTAKRTPALQAEAEKILQRLGLSPAVKKLYPFQLSGGMARRLLFATAALSEADLMIADEPTPGMHLDQALEALTILKEWRDQGKAVILITHDIDLAAEFADHLAIFYAGSILEVLPARDFLNRPENLRHPYTKALRQALPQYEFTALPGVQPYAGNLPSGCLFADRCPVARPDCRSCRPEMRSVGTGFVRCFYA